MMPQRKLRLAYVVSHPIQYQAPLLRRIAQEPDIDLTVFFGSAHSLAGYSDPGFGGVTVRWDVPLLEGYKSVFLPVIKPMKESGFTTPTNSGIFRELRKGRFDAVWIHGYWNTNAIVAMLSARLLGIPVLVRSDSTLSDRSRSALKLWIKRMFFSAMKHFVDATLPVSTLNARYWQHYLGDSVPAFMVPYAVDNGFFQRTAREAAARRGAFREELGLRPGVPVILYASKLMERKRCIDLVEAYFALRLRPGEEMPYLVIVGDGPERANLEARVRRETRHNLLFQGFRNQSELARYFDLCDLFVLPSVDEPFGLIVNEVMNAARPIIVSSEVGCQPDLVQDGDNGRVFPAGNVAALRDALESLLSDPALRRRMGQRSLEIVNQWSFDQDLEGLRGALAAL